MVPETEKLMDLSVKRKNGDSNRNYGKMGSVPISGEIMKSCCLKTTFAAILLLSAECAATSEETQAQITRHVKSHQSAIYGELLQLLSIPNVGDDRPNIRRNAEFLANMMGRRGIRVEILETAGNPLVYGEMRVPGASKTLLIYAHYDGQAIDRSRWKQADPFIPVLRNGRLEDGAREITGSATAGEFQSDWRLYGRSASDDKAPIVALCAAMDALKDSGLSPSSHIRVILDGEEESGSGSLIGVISRYRERFQADLMLVLDGPLHPSGRPTLTFGARGNLTLEVTIYGPKFALHSGHYGNWVPNPAMQLAQLLASMKDSRGRVLIEGFYDGIAPFTPAERKIREQVPDDLEGLKKLFGIIETDAVGNSLQEAIQYPSLNIRGMRSAYIGREARTIIPSEATAAIDIRLVKETPGSQMMEKVLRHIRKQGYRVVESEPDENIRSRFSHIAKVTFNRGEGMEAYRTEISLPISNAVIQTLKTAWGADPVVIRTSGGTVPISPFIQTLGFPAIGVPTVNFDNNQHSENENLRLGHFWNAIATIGALLQLDVLSALK
jgi:acetylornithine deacetylase/succinyl-diaminopimelate desuccinylase-like protein